MFGTDVGCGRVDHQGRVRQQQHSLKLGPRPPPIKQVRSRGMSRVSYQHAQVFSDGRHIHRASVVAFYLMMRLCIFTATARHTVAMLVSLLTSLPMLGRHAGR
jgi:hypothetical protein